MDNKIYLEKGTDVYKAHKNTFKAKGRKIWYEPMADYYISLAETQNNKKSTHDSLNAAKGIVSDDVLKEVLKQINDKNMTVEAKELNLLDDVDIITPIKERYMGEFVRTPNFYTTTLQGTDVTLAIKHKIQKHIFSIFSSKLKVLVDDMVKEEEAKQRAEAEQKQAAAEQNPEADPTQTNEPPSQSTMATDPPSAQDVVMSKLDMKEEVIKIKEEYYSKEAIKAKAIVDFFVADTRLEEMLYQLFYYYFATEEVYLKFNPVVGDLGIEIIHPEDYLRIASTQSIMVEDDEAGVIRTRTNIKDILDEFGDELSKDDVDYLSTLLSNFKPGNQVMPSTGDILERYVNHSDMYNYVKAKLGTNEKVLLAQGINEIYKYEYFYTTKRKVGTLTYIDEDGLPAKTTVGDDYQLNLEYGDIDIKWEWEDEVWKGYRFGAADGVGVYTKPKPILVQRSEMETKNTCKIPIIGLDGLLYDFGHKPIPARMLSHQALYIILTNKYRKELAKFHGFVNLIAESILSDSDEFTQEARLEYMYKDNLLIFNDAEVDVNTLQSLRTIGNSGQADYIRAINEMRMGVKAEAWDLANMNEQRYGNIDVRGGKGNTEEAIRRVSTGSVLLFTMFDMFKERVYQAISDYGRIVYVEGISTNFMKGQQLVELDIEHEELLSSDIGIHFTVSTLEREKMEAIRNAVVSNSVQTGNVLDAVEAIKQEDLESIKLYAAKLQKAKDEREERMAKDQQEAAKYVEDKRNELEQMKLGASKEEVDMKGKYDLLKKDKDIYIKMLELQYQQQLVDSGNDSNANGIPDNKGKLSADMEFLETEIKRQTLELTKAKVANEKKKTVN